MKKILILTVSIILFFPFSVFAQEVQTGNARAETKVETNVSGGSTYTKIEIEANGEKKVLETTEQGVHKLEVNSSKEVITNIEKASVSATITPKKTIENVGRSKKSTGSIIENFSKWIMDLFKSFNFK